MDEGETAAERKRRLGALGMGNADDSSPDSDSDAEEGGDPLETGRGSHAAQQAAARRTPGIRFAEQPRIPTKDERAQEDKDEKEAAAAESSRKGPLGKLRWKK